MTRVLNDCKDHSHVVCFVAGSCLAVSPGRIAHQSAKLLCEIDVVSLGVYVGVRIIPRKCCILVLRYALMFALDTAKNFPEIPGMHQLRWQIAYYLQVCYVTNLNWCYFNQLQRTYNPQLTSPTLNPFLNIKDQLLSFVLLPSFTKSFRYLKWRVS